MLEDLVLETFTGREKETFHLTVGDVRLDLELTEVSSRGVRTVAEHTKAKAALRKEAFGLVFRGPHEPALLQGTFLITHADLGELGDIFLVPIAQDEQGRYYEAIFS